MRATQRDSDGVHEMLQRKNRKQTNTHAKPQGFKSVNARHLPIRVGEPLQGVPTDKRSIWTAIREDDFLAEACRQWQPVAISYKGMKWEK